VVYRSAPYLNVQHANDFDGETLFSNKSPSIQIDAPEHRSVLKENRGLLPPV